MSKALITGITGQDGSHLAEQLIEKGYEVYGLVRRTSTDNTWRIRKILNKIELVSGDLTDQASLDKIINTIKPDEVYNLAAMSFVGASWANAESTMNVNTLGLLRLLEACRSFGKPDIKIFQASSSEQFGNITTKPQNERTRFHPRSPYGCSKAAAHWLAVNYRESYKMFVSTCISFNHTSHRRGLEFVERKISYNVAKIKLGMAEHIELGNLEAKRDWSWAPDFCHMFWKTLQQDKPDDYVLASGESHTVREFLIQAFKCVGIDEKDYINYVKFNPKYMRPAEVDYLQGDYNKAQCLLGFTPFVLFEDIVKIMVETDIERLERGDVF